MLNDLYNRQNVDEARMRRLLCLFRLDFANPADMRPATRRTTRMAGDGDGRAQPPAAQAAEPADEPAARTRSMNTLLIPERRSRRLGRRATLVAALLLGANAWAQQPPVPPEAAAPPPAPPSRPQPPTTSKLDDGGAFAALAWLEGCWQGTVNQREFREHWLPLRGGMLIGAGQSVLRGKMQDYEFLRIEPQERRRLLLAVLAAIARKPSFRLDKVVNDGQGHDIHVREHRRRIPGATRLSSRHRGLAVRDDRGEAERHRPAGHLSDAPRRLRDRRVDPQVAHDRFRFRTAAGQERSARKLRADARSRARTARCCAFRSATNTRRRAIGRAPSSRSRQAVAHGPAVHGRVEALRARIAGNRPAARGARRLPDRHRRRAGARATARRRRK